MAKLYGVEYPERQLMAVLSDLLGVPHFTTSRGSTVRRDFLEAVAARLDVPAPKEIPTKDDVLAACVEAATRRPMDPAMLSRGGTVTDRALQAVIDGVLENWHLGSVGGLEEGLRPPVGEQPAAVPGRSEPEIRLGLPVGQSAVDMRFAALEDLLDPDHLMDPLERRLLAAAYREGQDEFRSAVLTAYRKDSREACCITGHGPAQVLQAAHLIPHADGGLGVVSNGLCLRADLHTLMDRQLLAVHEDTLEVLVDPVLAPTPYSDLAGRRIHVPTAVADRPAPAALRYRRLSAGLGDDL